MIATKSLGEISNIYILNNLDGKNINLSDVLRLSILCELPNQVHAVHNTEYFYRQDFFGMKQTEVRTQ